jgi:hypothetical protein
MGPLPGYPLNPANIVHSVVLVVVSWGKQPLFARTVERGQSLWLGDRPSDLPLPPVAALGAESFPLVQFEHPWPVVTDLSEGNPAQRMLLSPGDTLTVKAGDFSLDLTRVEVDESDRRRFRAAVEPARWAATVAFLMLFTLAVMARSLPSLGLTEYGEIERALSIELSPPVGSREEAEAMTPPLHLSRVPARYLVPIYGIMRCGSDVMGRPEAIPETGRYAVQGSKDNADPHLARKRGGAPPALAVKPRSDRNAGGDRRAPIAPWARETALAHDEVSARGKLWGDPIEDARGNDGFGLPRVEGGIAKRLDWASADSPHSPPRIVHTGLRVQGPLRPSAVTAAVASRFDRFYACYDRARERSPEVGGRVELELEVGADGKVTAAAAENSTIADRGLTSCLVASVSDLKLPAEKSATRLAYPLFLEPGTGKHAQLQLARAERPKSLPPSCCSK